MTLTTKIYLFKTSGELPSQTELWELCADVCDFPMQHRPEPNKDDDMVSPLGVGAKAHIAVYGEYDHARVRLDTAYGAGGGEIHNNVVTSLIAAFPNCHIVANNEFEGEWHVNEVPYGD